MQVYSIKNSFAQINAEISKQSGIQGGPKSILKFQQHLRKIVQLYLKSY